MTVAQRLPRAAGREAKLASARLKRSVVALLRAVPGCKLPTSAGSARCQSAFASAGLGVGAFLGRPLGFAPRRAPVPPSPPPDPSPVGPALRAPQGPSELSSAPRRPLAPAPRNTAGPGECGRAARVRCCPETGAAAPGPSLASC